MVGLTQPSPSPFVIPVHDEFHERRSGSRICQIRTRRRRRKPRPTPSPQATLSTPHLHTLHHRLTHSPSDPRSYVLVKRQPALPGTSNLLPVDPRINLHQQEMADNRSAILKPRVPIGAGDRMGLPSRLGLETGGATAPRSPPGNVSYQQSVVSCEPRHGG